MSVWFLNAGQGKSCLVTAAFSGYFNNYNVLNIQIMLKNNSTNIYLYPCKFLIRASFVCISDEKRLYLFSSQKGFPPKFHVTDRYEHVVS